MRIVAFIDEDAVIVKILKHVGLSERLVITKLQREAHLVLFAGLEK